MELISVKRDGETLTYTGKAIQLTLTGSENNVMMQNCTYRAAIHGNGNKLILISEGKEKDPNFRSQISMIGNGNYVSLMGKNLDISIVGNGNEIDGDAQNSFISKNQGFGNLFPPSIKEIQVNKPPYYSGSQGINQDYRQINPYQN